MAKDGLVEIKHDTLDKELQRVKIITYRNDDIEEELEKYVEAKNNGEQIANSSFNDYLKQIHFPDDPKAIVVADLSHIRFEGLNLQNADLSGVLMAGAEFYFCDLTAATFCDTDLKAVSFYETMLTNVDFRGANLENCEFSISYQDWIDPSNPKSQGLKGIKFSTPPIMEREYLYENQIINESYQAERIEFEKNKAEKITRLEKEMKTERGWGDYYWAPYSEKYNQLASELNEVKGRQFDKKPSYAIDPSLLNIMGFERNFDPTYIRGSSQQERKLEKQYLELSREDVISYLEAVKTTPTLSLNDYAKQQAQAGNLRSQTEYKRRISINPEAKIVASCEAVDLSGLDFSNTKINGANFAKAKLEGCKFDYADISGASFEGANIKSASFVKTNALKANFFSSNISDTIIEDSNFLQSFMPRSKSENSEITNTNFDYANIRNGKWDGVKIVDSQFNKADLENISLVGTYMKAVELQHTILNNAILENSQIISSNFKASLMQGVQATNAKFEDTILKNVNAAFANFEQVKFDSLTSLEGADLENAILNYVEAEKVNFKDAYLGGVKAKYANLQEAILENANLSFADLESAILEKAKANNIDMTGCNLQKVNAKEAIFTDAIMKDINASQANLEKAVCENADLRGANFKAAILSEVNARKAKLQDVKTNEQTKATNMDVEEAEVNVLTDELKEAKGNVININSKGERVVKDINEHNTEVAAAAKERNSTFYGKAAAKLLGGFGNFAEKTGAFIKEPFSRRTGRIIGAVIGAVGAAAVITSLVLTAGLSLPVLIGVAVATGAVCTATGAAAGHFASKKVGALGFAGGIAGGLTLGPVVGLASGLAVAQGAEKLIENYTGKTGSEHIGNAMIASSAVANELKEKLEGGGEVGVNILKEQEALAHTRKLAVRSHHAGQKEAIAEFRLENALSNGTVISAEDPPKSQIAPLSEQTKHRVKVSYIQKLEAERGRISSQNNKETLIR